MIVGSMRDTGLMDVASGYATWLGDTPVARILDMIMESIETLPHQLTILCSMYDL